MEKWQLKNSKTIFDSKWLTLSENSYLLPNGQIGEEYLQMKRKDYVLIFAMDKEENILLERQYRRGIDDFNYELPAGNIERDETPETTAIREMKEETGYDIVVEKVSLIYPQPAYIEQLAYIVIAKIKGEQGEITREFDEYIEMQFVKLGALKAMIAKGEIKDMGLISALGFYLSYSKEKP